MRYNQNFGGGYWLNPMGGGYGYGGYPQMPPNFNFAPMPSYMMGSYGGGYPQMNGGGQMPGMPPPTNPGGGNAQAQTTTAAPAGTGAERDGMGWRAQRRQVRPMVQQYQADLAPLQARMADLQARGGTPGPKMQARMDALQGRIDAGQGMIHDLQNSWRTGRRDSRNAGTYDANAEAAKAPNPGATPVSPQNPQQGGAPSWYEGSQFNTPFGNLVQSSVGNGNIYKQNGSDGSTLYHYDPQAGWKSMTQQEYQGYNNPASFYQDPNQYAAAAGGNKSQMQMKNGMWQVQQGTGTYR